MLVFTLPAQIWVDRWGRRKPLITGGSAMSIYFIIIGSLYARYGRITPDAVILESHSAQWAVVVLIFLFVANFSWSWAVVSKCFVVNLAVVKTMLMDIGRQNLRLGDHSHAAAGKGMCGGATGQLDYEFRGNAYCTVVPASVSVGAVLFVWVLDAGGGGSVCGDAGDKGTELGGD